MFGKLAWNENRWKGWDSKGYKHRRDYGYGFVRKKGFGHEWLNFYDLAGEYYYGHIEDNPRDT